MATDVWSNAGKAVFSFLDETFSWGLASSENDNLKTTILQQQELLKTYQNSLEQIQNKANSTVSTSNLIKIGVVALAFAGVVGLISKSFVKKR